MDQRDLQPQTELPGPARRLPSDLEAAAGLASKPKPNLQALNQLSSSSLDAADIGQFGRQAQLVGLLDRLLSAIRLPSSSKDTKLAMLTELDSKIRNCLEIVMNELEWWQTLSCALVALCVR